MALLKTNGLPAVQLDAVTCRYLALNGGLSTLIAMTRGPHPYVARQLEEVERAAAIVSDLGQGARRAEAAIVSEAGHSLASLPGAWPVSSWVISVRDAAQRLGRDPRSVRRYAERGLLEADQLDGFGLVTRRSVDRLQAEHENGGRP